MFLISYLGGYSLFGFIGLDVVRTDRALLYYEYEYNQAKLWDVLAVYAWIDNDIGYVQGESLLAIIVSYLNWSAKVSH